MAKVLIPMAHDIVSNCACNVLITIQYGKMTEDVEEGGACPPLIMIGIGIDVDQLQ